VKTYVVFLLIMLPGIGLADRQSANSPYTVSTTVSLSDLDLATPQGMRAARDRLAKQALRLCLKLSDTRKVSDRQSVADCTRATLAAALGKLPAPPTMTLAGQNR
jgi:UrcA family protein